MESVNYLTKKGIDEKLILENSLISSSCVGLVIRKGCGCAMNLVKDWII
jgi:hypothetical protein